ncbi:preprotein translocase subunit SecY [Buchnera aphidicola]|uniref:Protein translocase subunit SecY n=1 Tax=Buchnera aphidicola (Cinara cf. splendens/pseudotsugae 3390) TaxID=2518980 RepID=A0A451CX32_9GAMM|nr:preprotein translocase subunit SecY [Buchnera aphidicola]VFP77899.1 Preprotein translocase subunit SecY [Buchnera aphidicola (Cinara cf. splendens/pseudotsugae 3390)]
MSILYNLKKRMFLVFIAILIFRIGSFIPIPGINMKVVEQFFIHKNSSLFTMFNMFSGGSLNRVSIFTLGVMPYISSSIIMQLLTLICSHLRNLKKEGEEGTKKINQYTKYLTLFLSVIQSISVVIGLPFIPGMKNIFVFTDFYFYIISIISMITGTIFLMWLGEFITDKGIGNGISLIIFFGIISSLPVSIKKTFSVMHIYDFNNLYFFLILLVMLFVIFIVVFFEKSQRNIIVCYARRHQGSNMHSSHHSYLPLKVNMAGVVPVIFSSSLLLFPSIIVTYCRHVFHDKIFLIKFFDFFKFNHSIFVFTNVVLIIFFCFFYTSVMFNSKDTAINLKKSGAFIPGIRPGLQTEQYIKKIVLKLTTIGSIYTVFICLIPDIMHYCLKVPFYFGGTSLLIVVVVLMEFIIQIQTLMMSTRYKKILKKASLYLKN